MSSHTSSHHVQQINDECAFGIDPCVPCMKGGCIGNISESGEGAKEVRGQRTEWPSQNAGH